ncbi:YusW family protein [Bacillus sp. FJAT-22090]|uniref:YusW family protein n=1 Tax=Bacillus sp. FJAT-22090 TaxID=1581038 RepID=UPI0016427596|nr:YusW family protein [Bacillus sp. FJAT-22090]
MQAKKHFLLTSALCTSVLLLGACGNNNDEPEENGPNGTAFEKEQEKTVDESITQENPDNDFGFRYFNLNINIPDNKDAILAEYYGNSSRAEALYKNMRAAADVQGDAAFTLLEQVFTDLHLTQDMTKEEVIERVAMAFDATDYTKFELEIEYEDGETITYSDSDK